MPKKIKLSELNLPEDLKKLNSDELNELCLQIREVIINTVAENGGHLSSNLGTVEATVAMHIAFDLKKDRLVWDVGHQSYTHKIISGRLKDIKKIRQSGGLSGFPKMSESEYDAFDTGHSSTSISAAYGLAKAGAMNKKNANYIAFIGDGALTGGLAFEGLNNAGRFKRNFIVVLNDNKMSISGNVGALSRYLSKIRTKTAYIKTKENMEKLLQNTPLVGNTAIKAIKTSKSALKNVLYKSTLFEDMGFTYYGPIDGHNIDEMVHIFKVAKEVNGPVLVHILTQKGKGYEFAEKHAAEFHGISKFDIETGESKYSVSFSSVFGDIMKKFANEDKRICAITAAMKAGTGLLEFSKEFKGRCFDVGIAEEHAVTFSGAMSVGGVLPVFAVYSTFLQRAYDQLLHDVSLQGAHVVLGIDRAGIGGEDGETHQGLFDVSLLNTVPGSTVFAPSYFDEMEPCFKKALYECKGLAAVRYPRGGELYKPCDYKYSGKHFDIYGDGNNTISIVTYGRIFSYATQAIRSLKRLGIGVNILKLNQIRPIDNEAVEYLLGRKKIFFFEEAQKAGSCGQALCLALAEKSYKGKYTLTAIDDEFVSSGTSSELLHKYKLDKDGMIEIIKKSTRRNIR